MKLCITNGRVIDPANEVDRTTSVYIAEGRIAGLDGGAEGFVADRTIDASGLVLVPGIVDLATRLREPGQEHKATIASETRAAAAAGITSLCCAPDTNPVIDSPAEVRYVRQRANAAGHCRVYTLGALTKGLNGNELSEMAALKQVGCVGVSNANRAVETTLILRRAMEYAASHDLTVFLHPIDTALANHGCAHEGPISTRLGLPGVPTAAETAALGVQLALVEQTGVRAHICRISSRRGMEIIAHAGSEGLPITTDVCAHQLHLTEMDIADYNSLCHTMPPLRAMRDRDGLREGLKSGAISAICSDHQPHDVDAKQAPFCATEPGISALETLLPLTLRLVDDGVLDLNQAIACLTSTPARILNIPAGDLSPGAAADICIYDPDKPWQLVADELCSNGKNTPFEGWEFDARVMYTLVSGKIVYDHAPHA
ncbi:MAG: dihydroorotase [Gammaproteobacteria bacterium]